MSNETLKEDILNQLEQKGANYLDMCHSCAQSTFLALQEQFGLGGGAAIVKSAAFLPGIAGRGETCGVVTGGLMALGIIFAPEKLEDWEGRREIREETGRVFCQRLEKEFGSLMCRDVQTLLFGRSFNLADPTDRAEFLKAGAWDKCPIPVRKAVRIAGEIIMEKGDMT